MSSTNTLGLDDDLDTVEVVKDLQTSFGVTFSNSEAGACRTVGDIYRLLQNHLPSQRDTGNGCASAMAFYRLRQAFRELGVEGKIEPNTTLDGLTRLSARSLLRRLQTISGLRSPNRSLSWAGAVAAMAIILCFFALLLSAVLFPRFWFVPIIVAAICVPVMWIDRGKLPSHCRTVGDLAQKFAAKNFGPLWATGARARDKDIWSAMIGVLSEYSDFPSRT